MEALGLRPAVAAAPVSEARAIELIQRSGVGGALGGEDVPALASVVVGVSRLIADHADRIVGVDVNPVAVLPSGAVALDGLIQAR